MKVGTIKYGDKIFVKVSRYRVETNRCWCDLISLWYIMIGIFYQDCKNRLLQS